MSSYQSLAHRYREIAIKTASPLQLIVMLYDAAICSLKEAQEHMCQKNIAGRSRAINKCIRIISDLQSSLNLKAGGEIAGSLYRLYDYMTRTLFKANVDQSSQALSEIEILLENLRSAWVELVNQAPGAAPAPARQLPADKLVGAPAPSDMRPKSFNVSI